MIIQSSCIAALIAVIVQAEPNPHGGVLILPVYDKHESNGELIDFLSHNRQGKSLNLDNEDISASVSPKHTRIRQGKFISNENSPKQGQQSQSVSQNSKVTTQKVQRKGKSVPQATKAHEGNVHKAKADTKKIQPQRQGKAIPNANDKSKISPRQQIKRKGKSVPSNTGGRKEVGAPETKDKPITTHKGKPERRGKSVPHMKEVSAFATKAQVQRKGKSLQGEKSQRTLKTQSGRKGKAVSELNGKKVTDANVQAQQKRIITNTNGKRQGKSVPLMKGNIDSEVNKGQVTPKRRQRKGKSKQAFKHKDISSKKMHDQKQSPIQQNSQPGRHGRILNGKPKAEDKFNEYDQADVTESSDKVNDKLNKKSDKANEESDKTNEDDNRTNVEYSKTNEEAELLTEKVGQGEDSFLEKTEERQGKSMDEDVQFSKLKITMRTGPVRPDGLRAKSITWFE